MLGSFKVTLFFTWHLKCTLSPGLLVWFSIVFWICGGPQVSTVKLVLVIKSGSATLGKLIFNILWMNGRKPLKSRAKSFSIMRQLSKNWSVLETRSVPEKLFVCYKLAPNVKTSLLHNKIISSDSENDHFKFTRVFSRIRPSTEYFLS